MDELKVFTGNAHPALARAVVDYLGIPLGRCDAFEFSNENIFVRILENVRERDTFVVQPICSPVNENLMELLILLDTLKRASAHRITAVIPYYGYGRQDRKAQPRTPITAKLVADLITVAGANRILLLDVHALQIQGYFNIPVDHLYALPVLLKYLKTKLGDNMTMVSPDTGGVARARAYASRLNADLAIIDKRRVGNVDKTEVLHIVGNVKDRCCWIVDDIIDTGGSLVKAAETLIEQGASEVNAVAIHPVFSKDALDKIHNSKITNY